MARSIQDIKKQIIGAKNSEVGLNGLNSTSQTAIWNLWAYIIAVCINLHEQLWDLFRNEVEMVVKNAAPGTLPWYKVKALEFQYETPNPPNPYNPQVLTLIDNVPQYPVVNPELRIVTRASVKLTGGGRIVIKVAKGSINELQPLNQSELTALKDYFDVLKFAGTFLKIETYDADRLGVYAKVYYQGQYVAEDVKANIETSIKQYLANLEFDGLVYKNKIIDAIQAVPGVVDVNLIRATARYASSTVGSESDIVQVYQTLSGYMIPEDEPDNTFDMTIEMIHERDL